MVLEKIKNISILIAVCAVLVVLIQLFFSSNISDDFAEQIQVQREDATRKLVQIAYNSIQPVIAEVRSGLLNKDEALEKILNIARTMKYMDEFGLNYIFMGSYDGIMLVQPFEPEKEGSNQWELKDANGKYIIRELVQAAKEKPLGSFVTYYYFPPDKQAEEEKLTYVMDIPKLEVYIGTVMYIESSYKSLQKLIINHHHCDQKYH